jgi:hypothetical protein
MANAVIMVAIIVCCVEVFIIWVLNDELKRQRDGRVAEGFEAPIVENVKPSTVPRSITAKDIAAGNLTRQVQRRGKSWADIRNRVESAFEHDPENERAKRIEKFVESYGRTADILNERKNLGEN